VAKEVFDVHMVGPHQIHRIPREPTITAEDLLEVPYGPRTESDLRHNCRVAIHYVAAWLGGAGCVPIEGLMEDAATAEISRSVIWQWVRHGALLDDGRRVDATMLRTALTGELDRLRATPPSAIEPARLADAAALLERLCTSATLPPFLTNAAYPRILTLDDQE
jgi:malate synthase